jgi:CheY-like chemotaxis protein
MAELTPSPRPADRSRLVLVADSDVESGKELASALSRWGLEALLAHDGVEAILAIQRALPAAVVLDAALPKMFGFQVCELMKRNTELRAIKVVLIGAIHHRDRYRRPPQEIYGADAYLERPELFHGLGTVLRDFGLPLERPAAAPAARPALAGDPPPIATHPAAPAPVAAPPPIAPPVAVASPVAPELPVAPPAPVPPPAPAAPDLLSDERAKAERLARIIVSDVILYNEEKFARAIARGNFVEAMDGDLEEGRALFRQRIDARVREERDFLSEELLRVARQRGAR